MKAPMTLVSIVTEGLLKEKIISLLRRNGATGFTITRAEGEGSRGVRARDFEGPNLKFECIVPKDAGIAIIDEVGETYFANYSMIAWLTEVLVVRGKKFVDGKD